MATYEYIIRNGNCDSTNHDHFHHGVVKTINDTVANQIPKNAVVSKVRVYLDANFDSVFGTLGESDLYMLFGSSTEATSGDTFYSGGLTSGSKEHIAEITPKVSLTHPFSINTSYAYIVLYHDSTTRRKYHCDLWKIIYDYSIPTYTLTVTAGTGGTVSGGGTYEAQKSVTLKATPNTGYKFVKWSDGNTSATRTVTVTGNATYTATFEKLKFTVTWKNGDTVLETDTNVEYGTTPTYNGSTPTKASTAQYSYTFSGWSPSVGAITGNTTYTAQFKSTVRKYTITVVPANEKTGTVTGGGTYEYGSSVTLTATPNTGYEFVQWADDGNPPATRTVTVVGDAEYVAFFIPKRCIVKTSVQPSGAGEINRGAEATYPYGQILELVAAPNDGYEFVKWSDGVTSDIRTITITGDVTYTAVFRLNKVYVGTSRIKAIYIGTTPVKAIYVGTTKVYEQ